MSSDAEPGPPEGGAVAHLRRALAHALDALRCTAALVLRQAERRAAALVRNAARLLLLVGLAILGVTLLACGLAGFLETKLGVPGAGPMIIGGIVLAAVGVFLVLGRGRSERK